MIIWMICMSTSQLISISFAFKKWRIGHLNVSKTETLPWMHPWIPKNIPLVIDFQSKMHANACLSQVYNYMDHMYVYFPAYFIIICLQKVENWSLECVINGNFAVDASVDTQKHTLSHRFSIKCIQMHA